MTWAYCPPKVMKNASVQQPLSIGPSPFPLSSLRIFIILRSFIPLFRIAYFPLQLFGIKMRLIESLAGWVRHFLYRSTAVASGHVGDC